MKEKQQDIHYLLCFGWMLLGMADRQISELEKAQNAKKLLDQLLYHEKKAQLEYLVKHGHGGGNFRRLLSLQLDQLKKTYKSSIPKTK